MRTPSRAVGLAAIATAVAGIAAVLGILQTRREESASAELRLTAARNAQRLLKGRLIGFAYAPSPDVSRGSPPPDIHLRAAVTGLLAAEDTGVEAALAHGLIGNLDMASEMLRRAIKDDPDDARAWTTLSAIRLEIGERRAQPRELIAAVAAADRALQLEPARVEAAFNRALALETLSLRMMAASAYEAYLLLDGGSEWAAEARARLGNLPGARHEEWNAARARLEKAVDEGDGQTVATLVRQYPLSARTWGETIYLGLWGKAVLSNERDRARHSLAVARAIGTELARWTSESLLADAAKRLDQLDESLLDDAAAAHSLYVDGRRAYNEGKLGPARQLLDEAAAGFAAVRSPMAQLARHFSANASFDKNDAGRCREVQDEIIGTAPPGHRALIAQALWQRSTLLGGEGRYYEALADASRARYLFEQLHEDDHAAQMSAHEAVLLARLGDPARAWEAWGAVFRRVDGRQNPGLLAGSLNAAGRFEIREAQWEVAEALFALQSQLSQVPRARFDALLWSSYARSRSGRPAGDLLSDLDRAVSAITDSSVREAALRDGQFARAALMPAAEAPAALALMSEVIDADTRAGSASRLPQAYRERARLHRLRNEDEAALEDLRQAAALIQKAGGAVDDNDLRDRFFGATHDVFADLADLLAARGSYGEALQALSRGRGASLLPELPATTLVVHQVMFDDHLLLVYGENGRAGAVSIDIPRERLNQLAESFRAAVLADDAKAINTTSRELHRLLIEPLPQFDRLIVIPDLAMASIPFAALRTRDGRLLIEEAHVSIAPSWEGPGTPPESSGLERVLVVGDPQFDPALFPDLQRLPAAAAEAGSVARLHGSSATLLTAGEASTERFAAAARQAGIVHIGAHALIDADDARHSAILLCTPLYLRDIRKLQLEKHPVIVLAACGTGGTGGGRGTVRTMASAFLAAGSRAVVATLWDVGDGEAAALVVPLHSELARGVTPREALRNAQLQMVRSGRPLRSWSGFQVYEAAADAVGKRGRK